MQQLEFMMSDLLAKEREKLVKTFENRLSLLECQMTKIMKNLESEVLSLRQEFLTGHTLQQDILKEMKIINQRQILSKKREVDGANAKIDREIQNTLNIKTSENKKLCDEMSENFSITSVGTVTMPDEQLIFCKEEILHDCLTSNFPSLVKHKNDLSESQSCSGSSCVSDLVSKEVKQNSIIHNRVSPSIAGSPTDSARFGKEQSDSPSSVDNQNKYNFDTAVTKELFVHDQCTLYQTRHKTDHPSTSYQPFKISCFDSEECNSLLEDENQKLLNVKHLNANMEKESTFDFCSYPSKNTSESKCCSYVQSKEKLYECPMCSKRFEGSGGLKYHLRMHASNDIPCVCKACGKKCNTSNSLKIHIHTVHNKHQTVCKVCGFICRQSSNLRSHMLTHTGVRKHKCQYCNKRFAHRGALLRHIRIHTGEKPYKCKECPAVFNDSSNLSRHVIMIHTREFPHRCSVCYKGFLAPGKLKEHENQCHS